MPRNTDPSPKKKPRRPKAASRPRRAPARSPRPSGPLAETYWQSVRKPVYALVFLLPMMLIYEAGVFFWGHEAAQHALSESHLPYQGQVLRNGADALIRLLLGNIAQYVGWSGLFLSGSVIVLTLVVWQLVTRQSWTVKLDHIVGMTGESVLYGSLLPLACVIINLKPFSGALGGASGTIMDLSFDMGAGVYEEFIFRFVLMGLLIFALVRLMELDFTPAAIIAAGVSSLVFALAHHVGPVGEPFRFSVFLFRTVLGFFFAAIFIARGFGIAAGTHVFYNILVRLVLLNSAA